MRLPTPRFSFISFYSCSRLSSSRSFSVYRSQCPSYTQRSLPPSKRPSDRRSLHATSPLGAPKDPYKTLGVAKDASAADVKKAYFALARKYHPDTNPDTNARDKFVEIQEAYDTLKDAKKRAAYDQYGSASQQQGFNPDAFSQAFQGGTGGFSGFHDFSSLFESGRNAKGPQSSFFENIFGAFNEGHPGGGSARRSRGADLETTINISFMESCKGATRKVKISPVVDCSPCAGSGLKPGAKRSTCTTCGGSGSRTFTIDGGFQMASTCSACGGAGTTVPRSSQCGSCGGVGKVRESKVVDIEIPAGVEDGMSIQIERAGDAPVTGKGTPGDLFVRIRVAASKQFTRQGANLFHQAKVPFHTALLGGKVRVPTTDGEVDVRLPAGTQQGEEMVLKGRGVPQVRSGFNGDLYVTFSVIIPRTLTKRQRELLQAYADDVEGRTPTGNTSTSTQSQKPKENDNDNVVGTEAPTPPDSERDEDKHEGGQDADAKEEKKRATG